METIKFKPVYDERIWGGRNLQTVVGRTTLPEGLKIGESREVFDFGGNDSSVIDGGKFNGIPLHEAVASHSAEIMGPHWDSQKKFPIIVKLLDCNDILSLQVHPTAAAAKKLGAEKKSENWYFLKCSPDAQFVAGANADATKEKLVESIGKPELESLLQFHKAEDGDSAFIESGTLHALGAGNLVLEIQENSTTTYRVFDWNRVDKNGKGRTLHLKESLESIDLSKKAEPIKACMQPYQTLCSCAEFSISKIVLQDGESFEVESGEQPRLISVAEGALADASGGGIARYETALIPYSASGTFTAKGQTVFLLTEDFAH